MERNRRGLVQALVTSPVWVTPIISSIALPAHAQTSACSSANLIGSWQLTIEGQGTITIELLANGGTDNSRYRYAFIESDSGFALDEDQGDVSYQANLEQPCTKMSGTGDLLDANGNVVGTRTFSMAKN